VYPEGPICDRSSGLVEGPRNFEGMDKIMVCPETWPPRPIQEPQTKEQSLGWDNPTQYVRAYRATEQKGWILLQVVPSTGSVYMGHEG
jgi:hypothetical protein